MSDDPNHNLMIGLAIAGTARADANFAATQAGEANQRAREAEAKAREVGLEGARIHDTYEQLLADPEVDAPLRGHRPIGEGGAAIRVVVVVHHLEDAQRFFQRFDFLAVIHGIFSSLHGREYIKARLPPRPDKFLN